MGQGNGVNEIYDGVGVFASGDSRPILAYKLLISSIATFFFQSTDNKQYTNSIRHRIFIIVFFFILGLDLTIGLIPVIAQKIRCAGSLYRCCRNIG